MLLASAISAIPVNDVRSPIQEDNETRKPCILQNAHWNIYMAAKTAAKLLELSSVTAASLARGLLLGQPRPLMYYPDCAGVPMRLVLSCLNF